MIETFYTVKYITFLQIKMVCVNTKMMKILPYLKYSIVDDARNYNYIFVYLYNITN